MATCELVKVRLDRQKLSALSTDQRFTFFFLGHAFNEVMSLQKLIVRTMPLDAEPVPANEGSVTTSLMLVRLAAGKLLEAIERINSKPVGPILASDYSSVVPDIKDRLRAINQNLGRSKWYHALRKQTFHYPNVEDWREWLDERHLSGLHFYIGDRAGNSLFFGSETIALASAMSAVNPADAMLGFDVVLAEITGTADMVCGLLQTCTAEYASEYLLSSEPEHLCIEDLPTLEGLHVPYFLG